MPEQRTAQALGQRDSFRRGGSYLLEALESQAALVPEFLSEDMRSFSDAAERFVKSRVLPSANALEAHDLTLLRQLMQEAGEKGFFACEVPEAYGGLDLPKLA